MDESGVSEPRGACTNASAKPPFGGATFVTAIGGMLLGLLLGWIAFAR